MTDEEVEALLKLYELYVVKSSGTDYWLLADSDGCLPAWPNIERRLPGKSSRDLTNMTNKTRFLSQFKRIFKEQQNHE